VPFADINLEIKEGNNFEVSVLFDVSAKVASFAF